jgi:hypothetical protein
MVSSSASAALPHVAHAHAGARVGALADEGGGSRRVGAAGYELVLSCADGALELFEDGAICGVEVGFARAPW